MEVAHGHRNLAAGCDRLPRRARLVLWLVPRDKEGKLVSQTGRLAQTLQRMRAVRQTLIDENVQYRCPLTKI